MVTPTIARCFQEEWFIMMNGSLWRTFSKALMPSRQDEHHFQTHDDCS
jgi:hypothetical protein